ncbi:MAG TPA: hypothetical protein VFL76_08745 [Edaphocola sp.]|nr:hypothetical protein [Edaphocola sp.]
MNLKYILLFGISPFITSCSNHKCPNKDDQAKGKMIKQGSRVTLYRDKEEVVSENNDTETVKGFDSCTPKQTAYLYQRLRLSKDSTDYDHFMDSLKNAPGFLTPNN